MKQGSSFLYLVGLCAAVAVAAVVLGSVDAWWQAVEAERLVLYSLLAGLLTGLTVGGVGVGTLLVRLYALRRMRERNVNIAQTPAYPAYQPAQPQVIVVPQAAQAAQPSYLFERGLSDVGGIGAASATYPPYPAHYPVTQFQTVAPFSNGNGNGVQPRYADELPWQAAPGAVNWDIL